MVKDANYSSVRDKIPNLYFVPYRQDKEVGSISVYVRTALPTAATVTQIRRVMRSLDSDLPLESLRTMDDQIRRNIQEDRLVLQLASAFSLLATLLAMLGLYGVMAYNVARRTREIGIRMALGAGTGRIQQMVFREVGMILGIGALLGVPAALGLARFAESQLFGVKSFDPMVILGALASLAAAACIAGFLPARRASTVNPISALRYE